MSLKLVRKEMKIKMLINEHIYKIIRSYVVCSSSHLCLGDVDETPCLLAGFSNLLAYLLGKIDTILMLCVFFWHLFSAFLDSSLYLSFSGRIHQDSRADYRLSCSGFSFLAHSASTLPPRYTRPPAGNSKFSPKVSL